MPDNPLEQEIEQAQAIYNSLIEFFVNYSMQVIGAILILVVGYFVARAVSRWLDRFLTAKNMDVTLTGLLSNATYLAILFCFIIIALGKFGISITPFVAALGAFTLGAGLAIQGVVGNYGAGFSIILSRPFVVGNTLTVQGVSGVVEQIKLSHTVLSTEDGEKITIPNKEIIGQILENSFEHKLVETIINIDLDADPNAIITTLASRLAESEDLADEPGFHIGIDEFSDSAIRIGIRFWVLTAEYYQAKYRVNGLIFDTLKSSGISLATPRLRLSNNS